MIFRKNKNLENLFQSIYVSYAIFKSLLMQLNQKKNLMCYNQIHLFLNMEGPSSCLASRLKGERIKTLKNIIICSKNKNSFILIFYLIHPRKI